MTEKDKAEPASHDRKTHKESKGSETSVKHLHGRTKQGIPVFKSDEDLGKLFGVDDSEDSPATKEDHKNARPSSPITRKKKKPPRLDKHGFPIMDSREDLEAALLKRDREIPEHASPRKPQPAETHQNSKEDTAKNKHGIRILNDDELPFDVSDTAKSEPKFEDLLYQSLGNKTMDVLIHEKKDAEKKRKKPTVKQLLKAYPDPQGQLDLHGYTALKAELRVESYLKNAYHNRTHTVNIIVGKGLHSEDGAVLPDVVETKLKTMKKEGFVLSYVWDKKRKSRSGAVIVYLNNWHIR